MTFLLIVKTINGSGCRWCYPDSDCESAMTPRPAPLRARGLRRRRAGPVGVRRPYYLRSAASSAPRSKGAAHPPDRSNVAAKRESIFPTLLGEVPDRER